MKVLLNPEPKLMKEKMPKTLEFGHEFVCGYKKHAGLVPVKDLVVNENIKSYVTYSEKQIHIWSSDNANQLKELDFFEATQSHTISCVVYCKKYMIYLAISEDFKVHVFNEHLRPIGYLPLNTRLVNYAYFYEEKSILITAGIDGCFMYKLNVLSKYEPRQGVNLDPEGTFFSCEIGPKKALESTPLWIKGLKVDMK